MKQQKIILSVIAAIVVIAGGVFVWKKIDSDKIQQEKIIQEEKLKKEQEEKSRLEEQAKIRLEQERIAKSTKIGNFQTANHATSGNVEISKGERGKFELKITNLKTDAGPDLKIIISPNDAANWKSNFVNLGNLKQFSGNFTFEIPQDTDLTQIQSVLIWCEEHDSLFGFANLTQK